jgi:hypothetical protein
MIDSSLSKNSRVKNLRIQTEIPMMKSLIENVLVFNANI